MELRPRVTWSAVVFQGYITFQCAKIKKQDDIDFSTTFSSIRVVLLVVNFA